MSRQIKKELKEYISDIASNFKYEACCEKILIHYEKSRLKQIRKAIILILKIYYDVPLTNKEEVLLSWYPLEFDVKTEVEKCIAKTCFNISRDTWNRVNKIRLGLEDHIMKYYKWSDETYLHISHKSYCEYLDSLDSYCDSLSHAVAYNHEISLRNPNPYGNRVYPKIDYDNPSLNKFISRKRIFKR